MLVFNAAFDGEQRAGARFRPETPNPSQPRKMGCTPFRLKVWQSGICGATMVRAAWSLRIPGSGCRSVTGRHRVFRLRCRS